MHSSVVSGMRPFRIEERVVSYNRCAQSNVQAYIFPFYSFGIPAGIEM
jgi:hypothetical protein